MSSFPRKSHNLRADPVLKRSVSDTTNHPVQKSYWLIPGYVQHLGHLFYMIESFSYLIERIILITEILKFFAIYYEIF